MVAGGLPPKTGFEHAAVAPGLHVPHAPQPLGGTLFGGGRNGIERAQAGVRLVCEVAQEIADENVGVREIRLGVEEISRGPGLVGVLAGRQPRDVTAVVFAVETVGEPGAAVDQRTREPGARRPVADV